MSTRATDKHAMREIDVMLYNACAKGSVREVERLVGLGADPSAPHWEKPWPEDLDENLYTEDYYSGVRRRADSRFPRSCPQGAVCGIWREGGLANNRTKSTKERGCHEQGRN